MKTKKESLLKISLAVAGIVLAGQSCAKDMTTQDYANELTAENSAKIQANEGTYQGTLNDSSGKPIGALSVVVKLDTTTSGANNNGGQNVGFAGVLEITPKSGTSGPAQPVRLSYQGAFFDFTAANYQITVPVTMPDGTTSDTIKVAGQFNNGVMTGQLYTVKFPYTQYVTSFNLVRGSSAPADSSLAPNTRSALVATEGDTALTYTGTSTLAGLSLPATLKLSSNYTPDQAFYSFLAPIIQIDAIVNLDAQGGLNGFLLDFKNVQFDQINHVISGDLNATGGTGYRLSCVPDNDGPGWWSCTVDTNSIEVIAFKPVTAGEH